MQWQDVEGVPGGWSQSQTFLLTHYMEQEAMENFVFPYKCSFMLIAMTKALLTNKLYKAFEDAWVTTTELKVS